MKNISGIPFYPASSIFSRAENLLEMPNFLSSGSSGIKNIVGISFYRFELWQTMIRELSFGKEF